MKNCVKTLNRQSGFIKVIHIMLLLANIVLYVTPELSNGGIFFVKLVFSVSLLFVTFCLKFQKDRYYYIFLFSSIFFFLIQMLYHFAGISSMAIGNYFNIFVFHVLSVTGLVVFRTYTPGEKRAIFRFFQLVVVFSVVTNIIMGIKVAGAHELVINYPNDYIGKNIARTAFYNLLAFFICANLLVSFKEKTFLGKLFDIICIVLSMVFLLTCSPRSTALLLTILMSMLLIILNIKSHGWRLFFCLIIILFVLVLTTSLSNVVLSMLPKRIADRFSAFVSKDFSSEYLHRFVLISNSIKTFFSSINTFFFGIGYHLGQDYSNLIGQHSILTDYPVSYGLFGVFFIILFFYNLFKFFLSDSMSKIDKNCIIAVLIGLLVISFMSKSFVPEIALSSIVVLSTATYPLLKKEIYI